MLLPWFFPPSGMFFPQVSTGQFSKEGKKEGRSFSKEKQSQSPLGKACRDRTPMGKSLDTQLILWGSGHLLHQLTSSASPQMPHNLQQIYPFLPGFVGSPFYLQIHLYCKLFSNQVLLILQTSPQNLCPQR